MYALIYKNTVVLEVSPVEFPIVGEGQWVPVTGDRPSAGDIYDPATATFGVDVAVAEAARMADLRRQRDILLSACDWTQLPDAALTDDQRTAWRRYRTALRDLPESQADPVLFPPMPGDKP